MKRRDFLKASMAGAAVLSMPKTMQAMPAPGDIPADKNSTIKPDAKEEPFHLGMAGFTFRHFDIDQTLDFMQKFQSPVYLKAFLQELADNGIVYELQDKQIRTLPAFRAPWQGGVGPIYMKSEAEVDRAFAYAKRVGVNLLVGVPNYELLDYTEKVVKQYDIRLAIHLHGPDMPLYPDATDIWNNVKDRDPRMGMCLDIGHNLRYGSDSLRDLKKYHTRVFDMHMKDVTGNTKANHSVEVGRGVIDFAQYVRIMRKVKYTGSVSLEYEKDMKTPFNGIAESVDHHEHAYAHVRLYLLLPARRTSNISSSHQMALPSHSPPHLYPPSAANDAYLTQLSHSQRLRIYFWHFFES